MFYDLSRAFDTVSTQFVGDKLYKLGIRGSLLEWVVSFLSGRSLCVEYGGVRSRQHSVDWGVAQGSVLGPLIFLLYCADMPSYVNVGHLVTFADDTAIVVHADSDVELRDLMERATIRLQQWCASNNLILNSDKTVYVCFQKCRIPAGLPNVVTSECVNFLGVRLDHRLSWEAHIDSVCRTLNSAYYAIRHMKSSLAPPDLLQLYYALAYSHLSYNVIMWGRVCESNRAFVLQKRLLRLIFNISPRESCRPIFMQNKVLTLPCLFIYKCAVFVKQNFQWFEQNRFLHDYPTRFGNKLRPLAHVTTLFERSPGYCCVTVYNKLSNEITSTENMAHFKRRVKDYLINNCFYTFNEFLECRQ